MGSVLKKEQGTVLCHILWGFKQLWKHINYLQKIQ